jgi:hypothetical protein
MYDDIRVLQVSNSVHVFYPSNLFDLCQPAKVLVTAKVMMWFSLPAFLRPEWSDYWKVMKGNMLDGVA